MSDPGGSDAVQVAMQLGRLDLITVILGVLTAVIAIFAFPIFLWLRHRAASVAREEVGKIADSLREDLEREATEYIQEMIPQLVKEHMELVKTLLPDDVADQIADAQGDGNGDPERNGESGPT